MAKSKKQEELEQQVEQLTADVQRTRADFENYRKRAEADKAAAYQHGQAAAVAKLLPAIDNIDRAITYMPEELAENKWAQSVQGLTKQVDKTLDALNVSRIPAAAGDEFNPDMHEAIQFDEDAEGEKEVIAEVLQAGYMANGTPLRHAMVRVTRK